MCRRANPQEVFLGFTQLLPEQGRETIRQTSLSTGEALADMAASWSEAAPKERRDLVGGLLTVEGLVYDLERQVIVGLIPRPSVLPVLALGLQQTGKWEQREGGLW
ncbi:hypothetical protein KSC_057690 [Ktedonobacter sp. SOSP1-52]|uniref:hypothetical protein n=1 Tax=Ktedonobacter sp. SOSP1-52 TaxID=2778366 RepID=UPI0019158B21|nr:hypothetical protein [Ktedonobacter sp. SOSP1-52]GHO66877.1 hypothetical protein KSC_057690 [Ktedonobacter sp. SOSP1-52]